MNNETIALILVIHGTESDMFSRDKADLYYRLALSRENMSSGFPTRSNTNLAVWLKILDLGSRGIVLY